MFALLPSPLLFKFLILHLGNLQDGRFQSWCGCQRRRRRVKPRRGRVVWPPPHKQGPLLRQPVCSSREFTFARRVSMFPPTVQRHAG